MKPPITLATLAQATAQEVFDQVAEHLLTQGKRAGEDLIDADVEIFISAAFCKYRSSDGCKCAAGCLIGDDEYRLEFEGASWSGLIDRGFVPQRHKDLIIELQEVHDHLAPEDWYAILHTMAQQYDFSIKVLKKFQKNKA